MSMGYRLYRKERGPAIYPCNRLPTTKCIRTALTLIGGNSTETILSAILLFGGRRRTNYAR